MSEQLIVPSPALDLSHEALEPRFEYSVLFFGFIKGAIAWIVEKAKTVGKVAKGASEAYNAGRAVVRFFRRLFGI